MKVYIDGASQIFLDNIKPDIKLFEGIYEYLESTSEDNKLSLYMAIGRRAEEKYGSYEIHFEFDSQEELDNLIKNLQEILLKK